MTLNNCFDLRQGILFFQAFEGGSGIGLAETKIIGDPFCLRHPQCLDGLEDELVRHIGEGDSGQLCYGTNCLAIRAITWKETMTDEYSFSNSGNHSAVGAQGSKKRIYRWLLSTMKTSRQGS